MNKQTQKHLHNYFFDIEEEALFGEPFDMNEYEIKFANDTEPDPLWYLYGENEAEEELLIPLEEFWPTDRNKYGHH